MALSELSPDFDHTDVARATSFLEKADIVVPDDKIERFQWSELDILMYEFKKMGWHITKQGQRLGLSLSGFEASRKTKFSNHIAHSPDLDNYKKRISYIVHYPPVGDEKNINTIDRYAMSMPGKGRISIFDRGMSNIASLITMKYISEQEYEESLEKLAEALIKWQEKGYLLQEYFCYITEEFQRERLYGRRNNPKKSHKFSPSDEKAMELYSEISGAYADLVDIFDNAGISLTIIKTEKKKKALKNWLRAVLDQMDYEKKSTKIDFTPDPEIIIANSDQVQAILRGEIDPYQTK